VIDLAANVRAVAVVDVVVVSYNSRATLRACIEQLAEDTSLEIYVVDNDSTDGNLSTIVDLPVNTIELGANYGFAYACNRGSEAGTSPFILFLNPDAIIDRDAVRTLVRALEHDEAVGAVAPMLVTPDGDLDFSLRHYPRLRSTYSQALFLHRLFPRASWVDEMVRDPAQYGDPGAIDWASGACLLIRRSAFEAIGRWDQAFFLYGEDVDICRRLSDAGYLVGYAPEAVATHLGGGSAPRAKLLPQLVRGRVQYVKKHEPAAVAFLHQLGLALGSLTHAALTSQGRAARVGQLQALPAAFARSRPGGPGAQPPDDAGSSTADGSTATT
jgi:GT2 family glycosyltransferase